MNSSMKTIVIAGRPNVGKSSIFNRIVGKKKALVLDTPGVTRDRLEEIVHLSDGKSNQHFRIIDTGGLGPGNFSDEIKHQVEIALSEADAVLYVCDGRTGLTHDDQEILLALRKSGILKSKKVIGVVNKADIAEREDWLDEFHVLGLDHLVAFSAEHNLGADELKSLLLNLFSDSGDEAEPSIEESAPSRIPSIAIVGQPNVGKSTLLNAICGDERVVTSPIAGTTVDPIDTLIEWNGEEFLLIDTAGIRRKSKTEQGIEVLSVVQTIKTLERADLVFLVLDGEKGISEQDEKIAGLIEEAGCSVILVLNKWDTQLGNKEFKQGDADERIRKQIRFLGYAPLVFTTAKEGIGIDRLFRIAKKVLGERELRIATNEVTDFVKAESEINNPFMAKFYMVQQQGQRPPRFVAYVNDPKKVHFSLQRHLVNAIRSRYGYTGTPIRFALSKSANTPK